MEKHYPTHFILMVLWGLGWINIEVLVRGNSVYDLKVLCELVS